MVFLYNTDIFPIIIVSSLILIFITVNRVLLPSMYFSVNEYVYYGDVNKTIKSAIFRVLIIILITLASSRLFLFTEIQIYSGLFIGCFLVVWPAIVQYRLFSFLHNKARLICLGGYILVIAGSVFSGFITLKLLIPILFENKEYYFLSNQGIEYIITMILYILPVTFESLLARITLFASSQTIDTFKYDVEIVIEQVRMESFTLRMYTYEIESLCKQNNVNVNMVKAILSLEQINRGQWYYKLLEGLLCKIFPRIAIKLDISVGLGQIRISTAHKTLKMAPIKFVKQLIEPEFNIEVCCCLLRQIIDEYDANYSDEFCEDIYEYISNTYMGQTKNNNLKTNVYSAVLSNISDGLSYNIE